jgi:hypothetical protein
MATEGLTEAVGKPKKPGIFRIFVRNIRKNFWIDPSTVIEKDDVCSRTLLVPRLTIVVQCDEPEARLSDNR